MIFSAYLGVSRGVVEWRRTVEDHAAWLGLRTRSVAHELPGGEVFAAAWLAPGDRWPQGSSSPGPGKARFATSPESPGGSGVSLELDLLTGELDVAVALTTPEHVYAASRAEAQVVGNDLRMMIRWTGFELDARGIYSLLRFGASLAPFTVARGVSRVPPGHAARLSPRGGTPVVSSSIDDTIDRGGAGRIDDPQGRLQATLDGVLESVPQGAALFFSGGVDSSLIASRLVSKSRMDVRLLYLSFGEKDPEREHARLVAAHMGLRLDEVELTEESIARLLERLGRDYSFPFGDPSMVPTHALARSALERWAPSAVVEGTGADGAHGVGLKLARWSRVGSLPPVLRRMLGGAYAGARLWTSAGKASRAMGIARRTATLPLPVAAILARNAFDGIAYTVPEGIRQQTDAEVDRLLAELGERLDPREGWSVLDLVTVCAERFANKSYEPLRHGGAPAIYPFLEPPMVRLSTSLTWEQKCRGGVKKALLKDLLSRGLPHALVYRTKAGFDPPFAETFSSRPMRDYLRDVVLAGHNPLRGFLHERTVVSMVERAARGASLDSDAYEFLWTIVAASGWLESMRNAGMRGA